jgi:hypothetical protein
MGAMAMHGYSSMELKSCAEVFETAVRRLSCCAFQRNAKTMGKLYKCRWRMCRKKYMFLQVELSHVLRFILICDLFTDTSKFEYIVMKICIYVYRTT